LCAIFRLNTTGIGANLRDAAMVKFPSEVNGAQNYAICGGLCRLLSNASNLNVKAV
jgi:hypothetical protein